MVLAASALASPPDSGSKIPASKTSLRKAPASKIMVGPASWYGKAFHGRTTASGEPYDMFQLTAAHKTLPLGTYLKVTNLKNGKWVVVRVNDRGPYVGDRIVDVSYAASQMLDFRSKGVQKVKLEVLQPQEMASLSRAEALD